MHLERIGFHGYDISMLNGLSPQSEQYLESVVAGGLYPSKEAALEAAVGALREKDEQIPMVPAEDMELVEEGLDAADAGHVRELTEEDWARLRERVLQISRDQHNGPS
jgi:hypothetical protein